MGRELRRKQAKKEGKSLAREEIVEKNQGKKFVYIICIVVTLICILYITTALFITKELDWFNKKEEKETTETEKVSNSILASAIFSQKETEYYVYFYDFNEEQNTLTENVNSKLSGKVYKVNTSSAMNSNYVAETSNKKATTLKDLKVVPKTLIKISNKKIVGYYEGNEITNFLNK